MAQTSAGPARFKGFELAPFQRRAAGALDAGSDVLVAAPTGAGKTLVAEYAIHAALAGGKRAIYTSPIKALSNQKFRDFRGDPAISSAGLMTGDITIHADARVLVMTTEILRNTLVEDPTRLNDVGAVVFDEVHYLDDPERGSVWEETLLFLPEGIVIVALSATIANLGQFAAWLVRARNKPVEVIEETKRPVPLKHFLYHPKAGVFPPSRLKPVRERFIASKRDRSYKLRDDGPLFQAIFEREELPALCFCFSRRLCESKARKAARANNLLDAGEAARAEALWISSAAELGFDLQQGPMADLRKMAMNGVAAHHAGMLPLHKEMVERLFTAGLLKLLFTTETFALGINMPARAVVFDSIAKFDGVDFDWLRTRDFMQMAGRAGRQGMDEVGLVYAVLEYDDVVEAPIHRIISGAVEPIISRFDLGYGTLIHLHGVAGSDGAADVWDRSFAAWQAREHSKQREEHNRRATRALLAKRYAFLRTMSYVDGEREVLARGRTALHLHGLEIHLTELLFEGVFEEADAPALCGLVSAVLHEGRRGEEFWRNALRPMRGLLRSAAGVIDRARDAEVDAGLAPSLKPLDEAMAPAIYEYALGRPFEELGRFTSAAAGDFVRVARMTVQYLRHLRKVTGPDNPSLAERLDEAVSLLYRGPVDVRQELGLG
ncbi:MAG: DEAD/DEAH box helicase, partial [Planctomycetota bacterium]|nr:DEAD/DEAH box helicase [Planctomycetota bacterium]